MTPRLSHIAFMVSLLFTFIFISGMYFDIVPRDSFSWGMTIFSFVFCLMAAGFSTTKR